MPTYTFRCPGCGPFDARRTMSALTDSTTCPACGEDAPRGVTAPALNAGGPTPPSPPTNGRHTRPAS